MKPKVHPQRPSLQTIMDAGLKDAADSFALIAGTTIKAKPGHLFLVQNNISLKTCEPSGQEIFLLTTSLMGHIPGASYLLFKQDDIDIMSKFPAFKNMRNADNTEHRMFTEMLLKELDNILSAKVITHLSNKLEVKMLGDVPQFERKSALAANESIDRYFPHEFKSLLYRTTLYHDLYPGFAPQFVWKFSSSIMNEVEPLVNSNVSKLIMSSLFEISAQTKS